MFHVLTVGLYSIEPVQVGLRTEHQRMRTARLADQLSLIRIGVDHSSIYI